MGLLPGRQLRGALRLELQGLGHYASSDGDEIDWMYATYRIFSFTFELYPDQSVGVIFFGGEPLLMRDLISQVIRYCREISSHTAQTFHFKVTTNGSLLDESFLAESPTSEVFVALSHDGVSPAHDAQRVDAGGEGTFARLRPAIDLLLRWKPYAPVMLVTTPPEM